RESFEPFIGRSSVVFSRITA
ncbi:hypothetical protein CF327_g7170, partial [Tilletia walkeri]